ncbi:MAG: hypothetical protein ACOC1X_01805 [Promethearchaeota archaeon]
MTILKLDLDWKANENWMHDFIETRKSMLEGMGYEVNDVIIRESGSGEGYHLWIFISPEVKSDMTILKLQWLLVDDLTRCKINYERLKKKKPILDWNIFYDQILHKKDRKNGETKALNYFLEQYEKLIKETRQYSYIENNNKRLTNRQLAEKLNITQNKVRNLKKRFGIK